MEEPSCTKFHELYTIIKNLRAPGGCPWDRKQTPRTFMTYIIEEAHELVEAIESNNAQHIREELGDLLFQIIMITSMFEEQGAFSMDDVMETISKKMIRRHPHVFGEAQISSDDELRKQWYAIKAGEKDSTEKVQCPLQSIPKSLPALRRAYRVSERAARTGFEWPGIESIMKKLTEELAEFEQARKAEDAKAVFNKLGSILLEIVNMGRLTGRNRSEDALNAAVDKFIARFQRQD